MPRIHTAVAIVVALLLNGCTKPEKEGELWVPGLTLPPGSSVHAREEMQQPPGGQAMPGTPKAALAIYFDHPEGWRRAVEHFDQELTAKGYVNLLAGPGAYEGERFEHQRNYDNSRSPYSLLLQKMDSPPGEFRLTIVRMK